MTQASRFSFSDLVKNHGETVAAAGCAVLLLGGWLMLHFTVAGASLQVVGLCLLVLAYIIGGYGSAIDGLTTLWEDRELDVDLLMIVAALGAAGLGWWKQEYELIIDGAVLILIFAISGALEGYAMARTERSIRSLMSLTPDLARSIVSGVERETPIDRLQVGDILLVKPGELMPTDAIVIAGNSTVNQSAITGESLPVEKSIGDEVFGGTLNGNGVLTLKVHQPPASSLIQRIIALVRQAQTATPASQAFIEKFERGYAKIIVVAGVLLATLPPFIWHWDWETTIYRALIFLVVASPCALMAAIMPTLLSGIANGARQGILFKGGNTLEALGQIKAVAFDKTGTLTTGNLAVVEIIPIERATPEEILQLAAAVENGSEHPIGRAIVMATQARNLPFDTATEMMASPGLGITGMLWQQPISVGKARLMSAEIQSKIAIHHALVDDIAATGKTIVWVASGDRLCGAIALADTLRPEAVELVRRLQQMGIAQIMLTGDRVESANAIAQQVGITQVHADLLPEDKVNLIQQLQSKYQAVAMVGDGINDAPALAAATVGIAMGVAGSDVALETADVVLMTDSLDKLEQAIKLGRRTQRAIEQNITFALSFIVLLLVGNFMGNLNMPLGVLGHEGSTVLVTLSGLRLLR
ncbi:heavy metal translocating P-type ATPase [Chamaesiphon minutus]|uniref:Heavy metal translocating P-type ATPase n=1 Tax=Chamaesiphon minutus (strain ATCC 27169 / PCC 6605) TaxID=1173020 RepID=K9UJL0_CHAP6|nr:heavy metal translocating P-type ATPase [Chamaesiphon minutus]AFY95267.1 heavy metal translocating P-type ATPase [Chamaesiphon minutus PCC 6605]